MIKRGGKSDTPGKDGGRTRVLSMAGQKPLILKKTRFVVSKGKDKGKEIVLQKPLVTIGTLSENDLTLTDPTVSRSHAVVEEKADGYALRDLNSTNGTFLDGVRIREGYLAAGAVIRLGQTEVTFSPMEERIETVRSSLDRFGKLIGASTPMREVFGILERVAPTDIAVLIQGETGTGKELAARAIHSHSRRTEKPFIVFDCGAVAPTLIESELFGHEKGAFTDAVKSRQGAFELAHGGTLFLDEIGELPHSMQAKLLRFLQEGELQRLGSNQAIRVDVRVIAATNSDLERLVTEGRFREDLYYRLAVFPIQLDPLRLRREDIEPLSNHFLREFCQEGQTSLKTLSPEASRVLERHAWPGNVRELKQVIERAIILSEDEPALRPEHVHFGKIVRASERNLMNVA